MYAGVMTSAAIQWDQSGLVGPLSTGPSRDSWSVAEDNWIITWAHTKRALSTIV